MPPLLYWGFGEICSLPKRTGSVDRLLNEQCCRFPRVNHLSPLPSTRHHDAFEPQRFSKETYRWRCFERSGIPDSTAEVIGQERSKSARLEFNVIKAVGVVRRWSAKIRRDWGRLGRSRSSRFGECLATRLSAKQDAKKWWPSLHVSFVAVEATSPWFLRKPKRQSRAPGAPSRDGQLQQAATPVTRKRNFSRRFIEFNKSFRQVFSLC